MSKARGPIHIPVGSPGFTLLELIVVLAGLGILSSLAIPNYMRYLDYAKVDEAKALLNSTAADCLQKLRRKSSAESLQDIKANDSIISIQRLKNTGYVFKDGIERITDEDHIPNCKSVSITAAREIDRKSRLPDLGFELFDDGTLTKISSDSGSETKFPCESWAGKNCAEEAALVEWQKLNEAIAKAKGECKKSFDSFIASGGTGPTKQWDPVKTSKCTTAPPKFEDPETCTALGCTKDVWYIDGKICGYSSPEFRECQKQKTTAACQAEKDLKSSEQPPWTTRTIDGDRLPNCEEPAWFIDGEDVGSSGAWKLRMCERKKKDLLTTTYSGPIEYCDEYDIYYICAGEEILGDREVAKAKFEECLTSNKNALCTNGLNNDAVKRGDGGAYTSPTPEGMTHPIPDDCGLKYWYCSGSGKIYRGSDAEKNYEADEACQSDECGKPAAKCKDSNWWYHRDCSWYSGCKGWI